MPWFVGDYLRDTPHLMAEEHGAYLMILGALWNMNGSLPADPDRLCSIAKVPPSRWPQVWPVIEPFFAVENGRVTQKRLTAELERAREHQAKASERGRQLAEKRWAQREECAPQCDTQCSASESPLEARAPLAGVDASGVSTSTTSGIGDHSDKCAPHSDTQCDTHSDTQCSPPPPPPPHSTSTAVPPAPPRERTAARAREPKGQDHPLTDATRTDLDADPHTTPPPKRTTSQAPESELASRRSTAEGLADMWRPLRLAVDPEDPIRDDGPWSVERMDGTGHLVRLLSKHPLDLIVRVMKFGMTDATAGKAGWRGWRYQVATLRDFARHFESMRKAMVAASSEPPPEPQAPRRNAGPEPPDYAAITREREAYERRMREEYQAAEAASGRTPVLKAQRRGGEPVRLGDVMRKGAR